MAAKTLRISPQTLRTIAASLKQSSTRSEQLQHTLERAWVQLDAGWDSYAEADLTHSYNHTLNEQGRTIAMLAQMAQALEAAADVIEAADLASQALFDLSLQPGDAPGSSGGSAGSYPGQGGGVFDGLPDNVQRYLDEFLEWYSNLMKGLPPNPSADDLLSVLDNQPVAIGFQFYVGASGALNPGAAGATGNIYVVYNFYSHELSLVTGGQIGIGSAVGGEVGGSLGGGYLLFYGAQSNDVLNGSCTNYSITGQAAALAGLEAGGSFSMMEDPETGEPAIGVGVTAGANGGAGGAVSVLYSAPEMNTAVVLYTIENVHLSSVDEIPSIVTSALANQVFTDAQQAIMIPLIAGITTGSVLWSGVENVIDLGGDIWEFLPAGSVNTSPFPPVPVQTPTQPTEQTPTLTPTPSSPTQDSTDHPIATPEANPTPEMTPTAPTETPTFQGTATPTPP